MKRLVIAGSLICVMAMPAMAAKVYLKDGGVIEARKVWRTKGTVHVLVNKESITEFSTQEVNMRRTFPPRPKVTKKTTPDASPQALTQAPAPSGTAAQQKPEEKKKGVTLPNLPKLPEKDPSALAGKEDGTIRKHKKEMADRAGE